MRAKNQVDYIRRMMADGRDHTITELATRLCIEATPEELIHQFKIYWRSWHKPDVNREPSFCDIDLFTQKYRGARRMTLQIINHLIYCQGEVIGISVKPVRLLRLTRKGRMKCRALNGGIMERYKETRHESLTG